MEPRQLGLGALSVLDDDLLVFILRKLPLSCFISLATVSKFFFMLSSLDELWEFLIWQQPPALRPKWQANWEQRKKNVESDGKGGPFIPLPEFFSDKLYYSWYYFNMDLSAFTGSESIPRVPKLSYSEFFSEYAVPNKPVIITEMTKDWACFTEWTKERMADKYLRQLAGVKKERHLFLKFSGYYTDMHHLPKAGKKVGDSIFRNSEGVLVPTDPNAYKVPDFFSEDYFSVLGDSRPIYRWLLIGGKGSGSCFHQDPNFTAAWNTSISGSKKFVLFPGDVVPPGVAKIGDDHFEAPTTVLTWFHEHYHNLVPGTFLEAIVKPGEMIYVPSGWWHTVLNMEETIAVRQNFVDHVNLPSVISYLAFHKPELHKQFVEALKEKMPSVYQNYLDNLEASKSDWDKMLEEDGDDDDDGFFL
eukprot:TRINITY_DN6672_c0_g1_i1.p1 TRINITY_DN6672_c0_g1~~TRINITY_DN6672_c0_g1_i1.p1  ORF type:complete len:475 (+),score=89.17 TRINITY_DN6672_c0_g1_i1:178-1425(+)